MTSLPRRSLVVSVAAAAAGRAAAQGPAGHGRPGRTALPPLDTRALRAAISDLSHPPATSAQRRVARADDRWYGSSGVAEIGSGRRARPHDAFRAGSVTKAFVATVALQLWARGRVRLSSPIGRYLPGLLPPAFARRITVTQLLNHTSGLPDHRGVPGLGTPEAVLRHRFDRWTPKEWVETVTHAPLKFRPAPGRNTAASTTCCSPCSSRS